jgi:hypothetical protein
VKLAVQGVGDGRSEGRAVEPLHFVVVVARGTSSPAAAKRSALCNVNGHIA